MAKKKTNENYIHDCGEAKIALAGHEKDLFSMGFSNDEVRQIIDTFLFHAPILKNNSKPDPFGTKTLKDYGWTGNKLPQLEGKLLKSAGITLFCMIKSTGKIDDTLEQMDFKDKICTTHHRAVLRWNVNVKLNEDGSTEVTTNESRMECLFRHLRNSIAHGHTYFFDNDNILIEDCDESGTVSARILMPKKALLDWVKILKNEE